MGEMTWEEAAAKIAAFEAQRAAEYEAVRAAITPHVLRAPRKQPPRMSGPRYANLMRAIESDTTGAYADYKPTTYCGAPRTIMDWDKRAAVARKNAALVVDSHVCADCLRIARGEG